MASGNSRGGFQDAGTAMLFLAAGQAASGIAKSLGEGSVIGQSFANNAGIGRALMHAAAGCANAAISGGDCGRGAVTAGVTKLAASNLPGDGSLPIGVVKYAVIGGTVSVLGGGKFSNGAITATYQYLFNCFWNQGPCFGGSAQERAYYEDGGTELNPLRRLWNAAFGTTEPVGGSNTLTVGANLTIAVISGGSISAGAYLNPGFGTMTFDAGFWFSMGSAYGLDSSLTGSLGYVQGNSTNLRGSSTAVNLGVDFGGVGGGGSATFARGRYNGAGISFGLKGLPLKPFPGGTASVVNSTTCAIGLSGVGCGAGN